MELTDMKEDKKVRTCLGNYYKAVIQPVMKNREESDYGHFRG